MTGPIDLRSLSNERPVHFMGVGGAGMFPLAELLLRSGGRVTGCDMKASQAVQDLEALGGLVAVGHDATHMERASALVVTAAVPGDHPEIQAARNAGIPVLKRAEALGAWVSQGTVVGIAGTHGKTTTTAMTTEILAAAGQNPTGLVGGRVAKWGGNLRYGSQDLFVVEADEYDRSFHTLSPDIAVRPIISTSMVTWMASGRASLSSSPVCGGADGWSSAPTITARPPCSRSLAQLGTPTAQQPARCCAQRMSRLSTGRPAAWSTKRESGPGR